MAFNHSFICVRPPPPPARMYMHIDNTTHQAKSNWVEKEGKEFGRCQEKEVPNYSFQALNANELFFSVLE